MNPIISRHSPYQQSTFEKMEAIRCYSLNEPSAESWRTRRSWFFQFVLLVELSSTFALPYDLIAAGVSVLLTALFRQIKPYNSVAVWVDLSRSISFSHLSFFNLLVRLFSTPYSLGRILMLRKKVTLGDPFSPIEGGFVLEYRSEDDGC